MVILLNLLLILTCLVLVVLILLQHGRGGGLAGMLGGAGGSEAFIGPGGATTMSWITVIVAFLFFLWCILYSLVPSGEARPIITTIPDASVPIAELPTPTPMGAQPPDNVVVPVQGAGGQAPLPLDAVAPMPPGEVPPAPPLPENVAPAPVEPALPAPQADAPAPMEVQPAAPQAEPPASEQDSAPPQDAAPPEP